MKKTMSARTLACILLILFAASISACQPTPEKAVVVGKNDGKLEQKLQQTSLPEAAAKPYEAPERIDLEMEGLPEGYRIVFGAGVEVPDQDTWPVYTAEPVAITQEQADTIRKALIGDTVLYKPGEYRSREEIQRSIDSYEEQLKESDGYPELIDSYQKILKDLYAEYEHTPENIVLDKADTNFAFMEEQLRPEFYGGKEVETEDGVRYEWTDEARSAAIQAGCESIYGVCWMGDGRKMVFGASNGDIARGLSFGSAEGNLKDSPGVTYTLEEAEKRGEELLKTMGLDFVLSDAETQPKIKENEQGDIVEAGMRWHTLTYRRDIEDALQDGITSWVDQDVGNDFGPPVQSEKITMTFDDSGLCVFSWGWPMRMAAQENPNVELMPFEEALSRIEQQLKSQTIWGNIDDSEAKWIDERRVEINKIKLSYLTIAKKDSMNRCYLIPVWNACGDMYYHYKSDYPTGQSNTYILDENFERNVWRSRYDTKDYSIATINAIDGSVVERRRGF
jgi:hypothetical protein